MTGYIFDIKEMAVHDGPGIRTTVFFKGCPLRCRWCHNPEGFVSVPQLMYRENRCRHCDCCKRTCSHEECQPYARCIYACPENCLSISGRSVETKELAKELIASAEMFGPSFGGFTFSGGEPLMQSRFLMDVIKKLDSYHLCIETSGYAEKEVFQQVIKTLDFVIMDIKLADPVQHQKYTGVRNEKILANFQLLKNSGKPYVIRTPLIPNITDTKENLTAIEKIVGDSTWEKIPYNQAAGAKYKMLGMEYELRT